MKNIFTGKAILVTGGTGSFGKKFSEIVLTKYRPKRLVVFSRDEYKQVMMQRQFSRHKNIRFFIGDVRDKDRLMRALVGVDYVVHAAALKQVPLMEYNPAEAIKTNVIGAMNVIDACLDRGIRKTVALSTDKACNPVNLYGATKLCSDKLFVAANSYTGSTGAKFSVVRYGNVMGSRGSVIPLFKEMKEKGELTVTHKEMTRFWITLEGAVGFVIKSFERMQGGEIFVPKIPSMSIMDLARSIAPHSRIKIIGLRPGEKMHEMMISQDDARYTKEFKDYYVIEPSIHPWWDDDNRIKGRLVPQGFTYRSDKNDAWLSVGQLKKVVSGLKVE